MKTEEIFKANKTDFYDANGAKTEILTLRRFDKAGQDLAIKFAEWLREEGWVLVRANNKEEAYVNSHLHTIYVHGSEYHFSKLITEHGKQIGELFIEFNS